jgi:hypothetical protein
MNVAPSLHTSPTAVRNYCSLHEKVNGVTATGGSCYLDYTLRYYRLAAWFRKLRKESRPSLGGEAGKEVRAVVYVSAITAQPDGHLP